MVHITPQKKALKKAAELLGGQAALARAVGIKPRSVWPWFERGVPVEHCIAIERITDGKVSCKQLRPDVFGVVKKPARLLATEA